MPEKFSGIWNSSDPPDKMPVLNVPVLVTAKVDAVIRP